MFLRSLSVKRVISGLFGGVYLPNQHTLASFSSSFVVDRCLLEFRR